MLGAITYLSEKQKQKDGIIETLLGFEPLVLSASSLVVRVPILRGARGRLVGLSVRCRLARVIATLRGETRRWRVTTWLRISALLRICALLLVVPVLRHVVNLVAVVVVVCSDKFEFELNCELFSGMTSLLRHLHPWPSQAESSKDQLLLLSKFSMRLTLK